MNKQVLLLEDVEDLGRSGQLVTVKPGFARNYLVPQRKGVYASKHTLRMQERLQHERAKQAEHDHAESSAVAKKIAGITLSTEVKVDEDGHMYGSVNAVDIVKLMGDEGLTIEKRIVVLPHPIKETGVHTINFKMKEGIFATCQLKVMVEGALDLEEEEEEYESEEEEEMTEES